jgi:hypothetical protein
MYFRRFRATQRCGNEQGSKSPAANFKMTIFEIEAISAKGILLGWLPLSLIRATKFFFTVYTVSGG